MPIVPLVLSLLALTAGTLAFPHGSGAASSTASTQASLLKEINRVRAAHGLRTLRADATLTRAAAAHTRQMTRTGAFAHGAFATRMVRFHVRGPFVGENLAWGTGSYGSARGIVRAWLNSPEHRENLLRPGFRRIGLGLRRAPFQGTAAANVVTADFAGF